MKKALRSALSISLLFLCFVASRTTAQGLQSSVTVTVTSQGVWEYTLTNNEAPTSDNWLTSFFLPINAPVSNVLGPNNWTVDTDNVSYILWANQENFPYPHDVAPSTSSSSFSFLSQSSGSDVTSTVSSWNHTADDAGPNVKLQVLSPNALAAVPEASTGQSLGALLLLLGGAIAARRSYGKRGW